VIGDVSSQPRVGLVLVSHSPALAVAARELALEFVGGPAPRIAIAAGRADGATGTNATRVAAAISEASQGVGVVVLTDLGSAVLAADMALELLNGRIDARVVPAPFIEGLLAAVVRASAGDDVDTVAREASAALDPKRALLPAAAAVEAAAHQEPDAAPFAEIATVVTVRNEGGLHARPASEIAALASGFSADITLTVAGRPAAPARSVLSISMLVAGPGTMVRIAATGDDAREAIDAISALIEGGFGEAIVGIDGPAATEIEPHRAAEGGALGVSAGRVVGPVAVLVHRIDEPSATVILAPPARRAAAAHRGRGDDLGRVGLPAPGAQGRRAPA